MSRSNTKMSIFALSMMTALSVISLTSLSVTASYGANMFFFYGIAVVFFLLPSALISAHLSAQFSQAGGVYIWVSSALGARFGFIAVWLQWAENVVWYPTILSGLAGALAYIFDYQGLENSRLYVMLVVVISFWLLTYLNSRGMEFTAKISTFCSVYGLILPMALIIISGLIWVARSMPIAIDLSIANIVPKFSDKSAIWSSLAQFMLAMSGIEIATVHARDVENPRAKFPIALICAAIFIFFSLLLSSLTIAVILPHEKINFVSGLMQTFLVCLECFHLTWALPIMGSMLVIGVIGSVSNWIIAPTRGLQIAFKHGQIMHYFQVENKHKAPVNLLVAQAIIVTVYSGVLLLLPNINQGFLILTTVASQLYMLMYFLMFISALVIFMRKPVDNIKSGFIIRSKKLIWFICSLGCIGVSTAFFVAYIPNAIFADSIGLFYGLLGTTFLLMVLLPFVLYKNKSSGK